MRRTVVALAVVLSCSALDAQTLSERGFVEGRGLLFPQTAPNDETRAVGDILAREEVFFKPSRWIQFAGGLDLRLNSHDQVEPWKLDEDLFDVDWEDRGMLRPRISLRRLSATLTAGPLTVDVGKQFIRWARADILNPTDRFAPRDYLNVIDSEFLPVIGVRPSLRIRSETIEAVWTPQITPSRMPLLDQRWTVLPSNTAGLSIHDAGSRFPTRPQYGVRWSHMGGRLEGALSYFDGFNHLPGLDARPRALPPIIAPPLDPDAVVAVTPRVLIPPIIDLTRVFPRLRTYGADMAVPMPWVTLKAETAYFTSPTDTFGSYALYVVEVERQTGEWVLTGGYAGEVNADSGPPLAFDPERGVARTIIGRAAYTVDPRRSVAIEGAARRSGDGGYVKGEYSQALGDYWRLTLTGIVLGGDTDDFLGQFKRNSHLSTALRFSF